MDGVKIRRNSTNTYILKRKNNFQNSTKKVSTFINVSSSDGICHEICNAGWTKEIFDQRNCSNRSCSEVGTVLEKSLFGFGWFRLRLWK